MRSRFFPVALAVALPALVSSLSAAPAGAVRQTVTGDLTLDQAVQIALRQNPNILKAIQQIEFTRGQIIEVRAQALPHIALTSSYFQQASTLLQRQGGIGTGGSGSAGSNLNSNLASQLGGISGLPSSTADQIENAVRDSSAQSANVQTFGGGDISWNVQVQATQVLYAGGQVRAALQIAKFTEDSSYFSLRDIVDTTIATVRQNFYTVLLDRELIKVQEESVKLLGSQLKDQQNRFDAGTVPRFNVLQAEVALANQQPILTTARGNYYLALAELARTLSVAPGSDGRPTFNPIGELGVNERPIGLKNSIDLGLERRPFLKVQRLQILIQKEQIKVALAGYKPQLSANGGYEVRNAPLTSHLDETIDGWFFGVTGQWNIFDGLETFGRVKQARASLESAKVNYDDSVHQVELEVQQAYVRLQTARATIRSGQKTVEQADEALRLAGERLSAGAGTQLDVLNAQVQRTTARSTELQARADYNVALADYDRVTATATKYAETFADPLVLRHAPKAVPVKNPAASKKAPLAQ